MCYEPRNEEFAKVCRDRDALEAEGCSMKLKLPDAEVYMDWREWLKQEVREDV